MKSKDRPDRQANDIHFDNVELRERYYAALAKYRIIHVNWGGYKLVTEGNIEEVLRTIEETAKTIQEGRRKEREMSRQK
ncbi:MAG TPA: hypothetical protein PKA19_02270 [Bacillota bacterium]|nr:hypothetical protein [Bacillota bacterium]